jgi:protein involved in polysaccharide export with SLBB domain
VLSELMRQYDADASGAFEDETELPDLDASDSPDIRMGTTSGGDTSGGAARPASQLTTELSQDPGTLTIQPDSILRISVNEDPGLGGSYPVNDIGAIALGYIGPVILYDMTVAMAGEKIERILLRRDFKTATVSVKILRPSYDRVRITGAVKRAGLIKVGAGDEVTLNNALVRAGGITGAPWETRVKVVRNGLKSMFVAYLGGEIYTLVDEAGNPSVPNVTLRNNDVAIVYSQAKQTRRGKKVRSRWVLVLGEVGSQGFYRFEPRARFTMMNLIFRMGELPPYANDRAIRVIRQDKDGIEHEYRVNVREILKEGDPDLDFPLVSGDRIIVPARRFQIL